STFSLLGLVGMIDPPRAEAIAAVQKCRTAGITVKMITGDHVETARAVARQLGIGDGHALTGAEIDRMPASAFSAAATHVDVFARVTPVHKLHLVQALQQHGEVVAMTGDGVNDAPALKQADIGIAMGITGTEVSKEAADMVLADDNFASIERAVEEGRTVFNNLKKALLFILPTNGGECLTLIAAIVAGVLLPVLPLHILWINLVTTVALAVTLAFEPVEADTMLQPPRRPDAPLIDRVLVWRIVFVSALMATGTFGLFFYELSLGTELEVARTVAVNVLVFFEVFYLFNTRSLTDPILNRQGLLGNPMVLAGIAVVVVLQVLFTYWPVMHLFFHTAPLDSGMWARILASGGGLLLAVEAEKAIVKRFVSRSG
ncbi:MAG: HAD-IC family P-type ATPase, partial [Candidatus Binatia bacterium]|nr:HAD-IC family P-type ATPase [Candidatus Binatia bacterium]